MYALVGLSVLACAFAAPQYYWPPPPPPPPPSHHHHHHHHPPHSDLNEFIGDGVFDTNRFWSDFERGMSQFEQVMNEFTQHFPKSESTSGLQGNQYKINIVLQGFEEKEITVKAREGLVMVQAVHKIEGGGESNYLDIRTLPSFVKADSGSWTYEETLLKVVFQVKENSISTTEASVTTEEVESTPEPDREEMESDETENNNQDADVGARGDSEVDTNEISQGKTPEIVESTTYSVVFNDDVEFVPVQMKQAPQEN